MSTAFESVEKFGFGDDILGSDRGDDDTSVLPFEVSCVIMARLQGGQSGRGQPFVDSEIRAAL